MSITAVRPSRLAAVPTYALWTLTKAGQAVDARIGITPLGLELQLYINNALLWSQVLPDRELRVLAEQERAELLERGWH